MAGDGGMAFDVDLAEFPGGVGFGPLADFFPQGFYVAPLIGDVVHDIDQFAVFVLPNGGTFVLLFFDGVNVAILQAPFEVGIEPGGHAAQVGVVAVADVFAKVQPGFLQGILVVGHVFAPEPGGDQADDVGEVPLARQAAGWVLAGLGH